MPSFSLCVQEVPARVPAAEPSAGTHDDRDGTDGAAACTDLIVDGEVADETGLEALLYVWFLSVGEKVDGMCCCSSCG